jgi:hypothetical protein
MSDWLAFSNTSNRWKQSYVQGFLDVSGGPLILRETADASFNGNLRVRQNLVCSGVVLQKANTVATTAFTLGTGTVQAPIYSTYLVATAATTTIALPPITESLRGAVLNFVKTNNPGITVNFAPHGTDAFVNNGATNPVTQFRLVPFKTSVAMLAAGNTWIEVGSSIGNDLSLNGNVVVGGQLTVAAGRTVLRETDVNGNLAVARSLAVGNALTVGGNVVLTASNAALIVRGGGFYPYQAATALNPSATGLFVGDNGQYRQAASAYTVAVGARALEGNTTPNGLVLNTGTNNVAVGASALRASSLGSYQVAVGTNAGQNSESGSQSVFVGAYAASSGFQTSQSTNNVVVGHYAAAVLGGTPAVEFANVAAVGAFALHNAVPNAPAAVVTGTTAVGALAGASATSATCSTLVGHLAGQSLNADFGTAVGYLAGKNSSQAHYFTAVGAQAGQNAGLYSTYLGGNTAGNFRNSSVVGYAAAAAADYEFVVGGDDGNGAGAMPLLTLPNKMKVGGVQVLNTNTLLQFRTEENVVVAAPALTVTLPAPNAVRGQLNLGARFRFQKTFTGTCTVNAPPGQTIFYLGNSYASYVSPAGEYSVTMVCVGTVGNTWLAVNAQGVDMKTTQSIQGVKTFVASPVFAGGAQIAGNLAVAGVSALADLAVAGNVVVANNGNLSVLAGGATNLGGELLVAGNVRMTATAFLTALQTAGNVQVGGNLAVLRGDTQLATLTAQGNVVVANGGNLSVSGNTILNNHALIQHTLTVGSDVALGGNLVLLSLQQQPMPLVKASTVGFTGNVDVAGNAVVQNDVTVRTGHVVVRSGNLFVGGSSALANVQTAGNLTVNGQAAFAQNVQTTGNLAVAGNVSVTGRLTALTGQLSVQGNAVVGNLTTAGAVTLLGGGLFPLQANVDLATTARTDASVFVGDTGQYRQGSSLRNIAIGGNALRGDAGAANGYLNTGSNNVAVGVQALQNTTTGASQVAVGFQAGRMATAAAQNVFVGTAAAAMGLKDAGSVNNVVVGDSAVSTTTGNMANVCAVGASSLLLAPSNAALDGLTAVGAFAGQSASSAVGATLIGFQAGTQLASDYATAVGYQAAALTSNASLNVTALGNSAGQAAGTNSTYLGALTRGTYQNVTAVGYNAEANADYELVLGGDDGNAAGTMPLVTLPYKMQIGAVQQFTGTTPISLSFRTPENVLLIGKTSTVNLPVWDAAPRGQAHVGAQFRLFKAFSGDVTVNAPNGAIMYNGNSSSSSYAFGANEYYAQFVCVSSSGNLWAATEVQGVDLKSAQTIAGGDKTFRANVVLAGPTTTFASNNVFFSSNVVVSPLSIAGNAVATFSVGNVVLNRSSPIVTASGDLVAPFYQSYYVKNLADISLNLPNIAASQFAGSELSFYKDASSVNFNVTLTPTTGEYVLPFGANTFASNYAFSSGKSFVKFVANNGVWYESGGGASSSSSTANGLTVSTGGASIAGTYPGTAYTLNVTGSVIATSYNASSDRRLKRNIRPLSSQWDTIRGIEPVAFQWAADGQPEYGFIAQQVYDVFPDLRPTFPQQHPLSTADAPVDTAGNPLYYALDYGRMTPFLWQGVRELMDKVQRLEEEVRQLRAERP